MIATSVTWKFIAWGIFSAWWTCQKQKNFWVPLVPKLVVPHFGPLVWVGGSGGGGVKVMLFNAATYQELLDHDPSKAHNFKKD